MSEIAISARGLTRYFGNRLVVNQVSFALPKGTVTGLGKGMGKLLVFHNTRAYRKALGFPITETDDKGCVVLRPYRANTRV